MLIFKVWLKWNVIVWTQGNNKNKKFNFIVLIMMFFIVFYPWKFCKHNVPDRLLLGERRISFIRMVAAECYKKYTLCGWDCLLYQSQLYKHRLANSNNETYVHTFADVCIFCWKVFSFLLSNKNIYNESNFWTRRQNKQFLLSE